MRLHSINLVVLFFSCDKCYKILHPKYFSFSGPNRILSLKTFGINKGPYDILYDYICYFDKFDTNGMYSTTTRELSISLFMCFRTFNFGQIKIIFRENENLKKSLLQM